MPSQIIVPAPSTQPLGVWPQAVTPAGAGTSAAVVTQNAAELERVSLAAPVYIDTIRVVNGATVDGSIDVGVYRFNGTDYVRLASSGSTAQSGTSAAQALTLTAGVWVQDGDYLAFASNSATNTVRQALHISSALVGAPLNLSLVKASSFPLPATISTPSAASRTVVLVGYRA
jgi:hypothetical protein